MAIKKLMESRVNRQNRTRRGILPFALLTLFLCLALACAAASAAALTWEEYAKDVRVLEESIGIYADWSAAEKENLIKAMVDMGHIRESASTAILFENSMSEESKHALADQIMLNFLGGDSNPLVRKDGARAIRWELITDVILGKPSTWTLKERVWYQQTTNMFGREDPDTLVLPDDDDLPQMEAVAIARKAIISAYGLAEDALDGFMPDADLYITDSGLFEEEPRPHYRRWRVSFLFYHYGREDGRTEVEGYSAIVDPNGHVIADTELGQPHVRERALDRKTWPEEESPAIVQAFREYAERESTYFPWQWSAETKAEYSRQIRPQVLSSLEKGDLAALSTPSFGGEPIRELIDSTVFAYGLPEGENLQEAEAYQLAQRVLADEYGLSEDDLKRYAGYTSFDITTPDIPLWKILFCPKSFEGMETVLLYKVELNACTEEVTSIRTVDWDELFQNQAYDLLLY